MRVTRNCKRPRKNISLPCWTERQHKRGRGMKTLTLLNSHSASFRDDGWEKREDNERETAKKVRGGSERKENRMPRLGQAGAKASFQRSHCPWRRHKGVRDIKDASQSYRRRRCTSPILALRAANKPFRPFDTRNSVFSRDRIGARDRSSAEKKGTSLSELATG